MFSRNLGGIDWRAASASPFTGPSGEAATTTETGLTADEIRLGTITDKGSAERPGLTQEMYDAAVAFAAWCNEHGGIGGGARAPRGHPCRPFWVGPTTRGAGPA